MTKIDQSFLYTIIFSYETGRIVDGEEGGVLLGVSKLTFCLM